MKELFVAEAILYLFNNLYGNLFLLITYGLVIYELMTFHVCLIIYGHSTILDQIIYSQCRLCIFSKYFKHFFMQLFSFDQYCCRKTNKFTSQSLHFVYNWGIISMQSQRDFDRIEVLCCLVIEVKGLLESTMELLAMMRCDKIFFLLMWQVFLNLQYIISVFLQTALHQLKRLYHDFMK